ncbi:MAG: hypothetical protein JXA69_09055 [Phycisphaerae bacterium]|nr:hypothetical protein [Phycisphaerae bacterium]
MILVLAAGVAPVRSAADEPASAADTIGLRFTPEIARGMARLITKEMFVNRYDMAPERVDDVADRVAHRLMAFAHEHQDQAQEFAEFIGGEMLAYFNAPDRKPGRAGIPRSLGTGFGKRMLPIMPSVRKLIAGVREDAQPLLPPKQQVRLMGDMMALGAAMDVFESHMKRWSKGDVDPYANPFQPDISDSEPGQTGESPALERAKGQAQWSVADSKQVSWKQYVTHAKELYALDEAQAATADSILAEAISRAEQIKTAPTWYESIYRIAVWSHLWRYMGLSYDHPAHAHLVDVLDEQQIVLDEIGEELRVRVDEIPTDAQREAAEQRIRAAMAGTGYDVLLDETR